MNNQEINKESTVVNIVNLCAIDSFISILDLCPDLKTIMEKGETTTDDWDLLFTAAGVGFALITDNNLDKNSILKTCEAINPLLPKAIENYFSLVSSIDKDDRELLSGQTGVWIVWNLMKEKPVIEDHLKLISLLGHFIDNILKSNN